MMNARRRFFLFLCIFILLMAVAPSLYDAQVTYAETVYKVQTRPDLPNEGVSIEYTLENANLTEPQLRYGDMAKGICSGSPLRLKGTARVTADKTFPNVKFYVQVFGGVNSKDTSYTVNAGSAAAEWKFDLAVDVPADTRAIGYTISWERVTSSRGYHEASLFWDARSPGSIMPSSSEVPCTVTVLEGNMEVSYRDTGNWIPVPKNLKLRIGDTIRFKDYGRATLVFPDGATFRVKSNTELTLRNEGFYLKNGETFFDVQKQGKNFQVLVPNSAIGVLGTVFSVTVSASGQTVVKTFEGTVQVTSIVNNQSTQVTAGQTITLTQSGLGTKSSFDSKMEKAQWDKDFAVTAATGTASSPTQPRSSSGSPGSSGSAGNPLLPSCTLLQELLG